MAPESAGNGPGDPVDLSLNAFDLPPAGSHPAVLADVIALGISDHPKYGGQERLRFVWQLQTENPEIGARYEISEFFNATIGRKSKLRERCEEILGRPLSVERDTLHPDPRRLIGACVMLHIVAHQREDGSPTVKVKMVSAWPKGMARLAIEHYERKDLAPRNGRG